MNEMQMNGISLNNLSCGVVTRWLALACLGCLLPCWGAVPEKDIASPESALVRAGGHRFTLSNGLRVVLEELHEQPLLRLELRSGWSPKTMEGRSWALGALRQALEGGAGRMSESVFGRSLQESAIRLKRRAGESFFSCALVADSRNQEAAFEHLAHAVFRPEFDKEGAEASRLKLADRIALHRHLVRPERSVLVIRGDLDVAQARSLALLYLGTWMPAPAGMPTLAPGKPVQRMISPLEITDSRKRAAHLLLSKLLSRGAARDGADLEARLEDGQPMGISFDPSALPWVKALCRNGFTAGDLLWAKNVLAHEKTALNLHPEALVAYRAQAELLGDAGSHVLEVDLRELNKALVERLGAF